MHDAAYRHASLEIRSPGRLLWLVAAALLLALPGSAWARPQKTGAPAGELSRTARPWEFFSAVGRRSSFLGAENGRMEAWVYPLKLVRDLRLRFHAEGQITPAEALVRTVSVRPESSSLLYTGDTFSVKETFLAPVEERGLVILIEVETEAPLEIEVLFQRDFQLEWPAAVGGTYLNWEPALHAVSFGEESKRFVGFIGSPSATAPQLEFQTNYSASSGSSFRLGEIAKGRASRVIVLAASASGRAEAEETYKKLSENYAGLSEAGAAYYRNYLARTVALDLPDKELEAAYDWSRVSMIQGLVTNSTLGTGLIAGYRTSGEGQRPGFAWYFGRDSLWTDLALHSTGDFTTARMALDFLGKYQRADGKMPHEISQGASFVDWFKDYPYAYASADATPLYIIAANDYVRTSGDVAWAREKWDSFQRAYEFLRSSYDLRGLPQNFGFGHGWVEGGPLLPVKTELYQSGLGAEALRALASLSRLAGKESASTELSQAFEKQKALVNTAFWSMDKRMFAFALDQADKQVTEPSVLATVPMWFGLLDEDKSETMIDLLSSVDHQPDWGMRILSNKSPLFGGAGYHYGSVWPLFTGWAAVGEYRYHRPHPAYANLRANALLALDGSPGHVTEVLSGDYYQPLAYSSPHQIWSAAMVVSPLLRGMLGLEIDAVEHTLKLAPHFPADWNRVGAQNIPVGGTVLNLRYSRTPDTIVLQAENTGTEPVTLEFSPALSLRAKVSGVDVNNRAVPFHVETTSVDQHAGVRFAVPNGSSTLRIRVRDDFAFSYASALPLLGGKSRGLRVLSEVWSADHSRLDVRVSGAPGDSYELALRGGAQLGSFEGGKIVKTDSGEYRAQFTIPGPASDSYAELALSFLFADRNPGRKPK